MTHREKKLHKACVFVQRINIGAKDDLSGKEFGGSKQKTGSFLPFG